MNRIYHRWFSPRLCRVFEILMVGRGGTPESISRLYEKISSDSEGETVVIFENYVGY